MSNSTDGITKDEYMRQIGQGEKLWQAGRPAEAAAIFADLLKRLEAGATFDTAFQQACVRWDIGRCLKDQGLPTQAIPYHRRALDVFAKLSETDAAAKLNWGAVYIDLGNSLVAAGQYDEAQRVYEEGLRILRETGHARNIAGALGQIGTLAMQRGDLAEAHRSFVEALTSFQALGDSRMEAVTWHNLGMVGESAYDWPQAEGCYRQAVRIREQIGDLAGLLTDYNQLAIVARLVGRLEEAERWCLQAIKLGEQLHNPAVLGKMRNNLADIYLQQDRLREAEREARAALKIKEGLDPSAELWAAYSTLAKIAAARRRDREAADWRRKAQESYAAYPGSGYEIQKYQSLMAAIVGAARGDAEARAFVQGECLKMEASGKVWSHMADAVRRIVAGERNIERLRGELDFGSFVIVRTILSQLSEKDEGG